MPTHNRAQDLAVAVRSVLEQQVEHLEVVVVDDGSSDDTAEVLDRLCDTDKRIRVVRNDVAEGPCVARNLGLDAAEGELVATCDDDDKWLDGAGRTMVEFMSENPAVGAASSWHEVVHGSRNVTFRGPIDYSARILLWVNVVAIPFIVMRRSAFAVDPRYDPSFAGGEDWELCLRCALEQPIRSVPAPLYSYVQRGSGRVTSDKTMPRRVRQAFVEKHGEQMSRTCIAYHKAVGDLAADGRSYMLREMAEGVRRSPSNTAAAMGAASFLSTAMIAARVGVRRGDPGLAARVMTRLIDR